jgi:hypothetical protein
MHPCQGLGRRRRNFADEAAVGSTRQRNGRRQPTAEPVGIDARPDGLPTSRTHNTRTQRHTRPRSRRLIGQLGDPSAQISGALADRAVVGMPADAAAVAHREGVLPGGKKRPQFLSKLVHVLHGCLRSWSRASRRRRLASHIERRRRLLRYIRPDNVVCTCGRPPRRRAAPPAVVVPLDNIGTGARPSSPDVTKVVHAARRARLTTARRPDRPCLLHGLLPASQEGPGEPRQAWLRRNVLCVESRSVPSSSKAEARRGRVLRGWADCARFVGNGREPGASGDTRYRSSGGAPRRRSAVGAAPCRIACLHGNARQTCARTISSCSSSDRDPPCR